MATEQHPAKKANRQPTSQRKGDFQLTGIRKKVFLDRYAIPDTDPVFRAGDEVVAIVDDSNPQWPVQAICTVEEVVGNTARVVGQEDGTVYEVELKKLTRPLETTPDVMWDRMADAIVEVEKPGVRDRYRKEFRWLLDEFRFSPGGRINKMLGANKALTAYNCYVIPLRADDHITVTLQQEQEIEQKIERILKQGGNAADVINQLREYRQRFGADSRRAALDTLRNMVEIMSRGGGVGINVSALRPRLSKVFGVQGRSSGAVSWMGGYSYYTGLIEQGGCFDGEQRIATTKGLIPAAELAARIEQGEYFEALTHEGPRLITARFRNGQKEVYRVTTSRGFTVNVTAEHKMGVFRTGRLTTVPLQDLQPGDEILTLLGTGVEAEYVKLSPVHYERSVMSTTLNEEVCLPEVLDERLAYLVGYMHGDGYVNIGKKKNWQAPKAIKMASGDAYPEIRQTLVQLSEDLFGLRAVVEDRPGDGCANVSLYSRLLMEWLTQNGLLKQKAEEVRVPESIFRSPSSVMGAFIAGYFDADGSDRTRKGGYGFDSVSLGMVHDVQQLLAVNGILSHITATDRSDNGWRTIYRLCVTGAEFKERMSAFISMAHKAKGLSGHRNHGNNYPREVWPALGVPGRYYQGLWDSTKDRISYRALTRIKDRLVTDGRVALAEAVDAILNVVPDAIVSIQPLGVKEVFDFEVLDVHMLAGNGVYTSNSRRGALMLMIYCWHPDVEEFINCKRDMSKVTNANISVCVTDDFMAAVKNDDWWDLVFPDYEAVGKKVYDEHWDGDLEAWQALGYPVKTYKRVKARDVWKQIYESAHASAEPGIVWMERYNKYSNSWYYGRIHTTNPCVTGDTLLYTDYGLQRAEDLYFQQEAVRVAADSRLGNTQFVPASEVFATGIKPVFRLATSEGFELRLTEDHRVLTENRGWVEARQLVAGDKILVHNREGGFGTEGSLDLGRVLGWLVGDGTIKKDEAVLSLFGGEKAELAPAFAAAVNRVVRPSLNGRKYSIGVIELPQRDESRIGSTRLGEIAHEHGLLEEKLRVPDAVFLGTREMQQGFLQGLFTADGHVEVADGSRGAVVLTSKSMRLLQEVQRLLVNFGIYSRIYRNRHSERQHLLPDGHGGRSLYNSEPVHDLRITRSSIFRFRDSIGFLLSRKQEKLDTLVGRYTRGPYNERFVATFEALVPDGEEMVYDLNVPDIHAFSANGLVVHNCGEQGLPAWGVCLLGHHYLPRYARRNEATGKYEVNWKQLEKGVRLGTRFLDNVIDYTEYFFEENEDWQKGERRQGQGTLGLGELLCMLELQYGSPESLEFIDQLYAFIARIAYDESANLAKEKGSFPFFDPEKYLESGFMKGMPEDVREKIRRQGARGVCLLTQAPTGSTGTMVGTSTGIEPFFKWVYKRRSRLGEDIVFEPFLERWANEHPEWNLNIQYLEKDYSYMVTAMSQRHEIGDIVHVRFASETTRAQRMVKGRLVERWDDPARIQDPLLTVELDEPTDGKTRWQLPIGKVIGPPALTPEAHVLVQAAVQRWTDSSISKTANAPSTYTAEDVNRLYAFGYEHGLKGLTVYVDQSRNIQVLSETDDHLVWVPAFSDEITAGTPSPEQANGKANAEAGDRPQALAPPPASNGSAEIVSQIPATATHVIAAAADYVRHSQHKRPTIVTGTTEKIDTPLGKLYVVTNFNQDGELVEIFGITGENGGELEACVKAIGRLASLALKNEVPAEDVAKQLRKVKGYQAWWHRAEGDAKGELLHSIPDAIGFVLHRYIEKKVQLQLDFGNGATGGSATQATATEVARTIDAVQRGEESWVGADVAAVDETGLGLGGRRCPHCGGSLTPQEGCWTCFGCGYSKCG